MFRRYNQKRKKRALLIISTIFAFGIFIGASQIFFLTYIHPGGKKNDYKIHMKTMQKMFVRTPQEYEDSSVHAVPTFFQNKLFEILATTELYILKETTGKVSESQISNNHTQTMAFLRPSSSFTKNSYSSELTPQNVDYGMPYLMWTRYPTDFAGMKHFNSSSGDSNFSCSLMNTDKNNDDLRFYYLPLIFRKYYDRPKPQPKCGCNNLLYPWMHTHTPLVDMVFLVKTAPSNIKRRKVIRSTWGSIQSLRGMRFVTIFLIGLARNQKNQDLLFQENKLFGDMLQCNLLDSYENLPVKVLSSFRWILESRITSTYFTVTDDDCVINPLRVNTYFQETVADDIIYCGFMYDEGAKPNRKLGGKWYVSRKRYSKGRYPTFCHGGMWTVSKSLMRDLYCMSEVTNRNEFHLEDVYITGILRRKLGYQDQNIKPVVTKSGRKFELMYYPWDESEKAHVKMAVRWRQWNHTLPWKSKATISGQPIMQIYSKKDEAATNLLIDKWQKLQYRRTLSVKNNTA